jgi:hypothetical protein
VSNVYGGSELPSFLHCGQRIGKMICASSFDDALEMVPLPAAELLDDGFADLWAGLTYLSRPSEPNGFPGVVREGLSEGSVEQSRDPTNRNRIRGRACLEAIMRNYLLGYLSKA